MCKIEQHSYTTKQIADAIGIHVNTVRFYEKIGFLTKPLRRPNGYRVYTELQLEQCRLIRCAMRAEVLQNGLRKQAIEIVKLCAQQNYDASLKAAKDYGVMIQNEIDRAKAAIVAVEKILNNQSQDQKTYKTRLEAAKSLGVTSETLRTWERSGLLSVARLENGYRAYSPTDMERLNIIRTLRCSNYSLSAILRLLNQLEQHTNQSVEDILNTVDSEEDIISVCDRLIVSLQSTASDADLIVSMVKKMKSKFSTIQ